MKNAVAILTVWGLGILFAGTATAHEYVVYRGHHRHHPAVAVYPPVLVARPVLVERRVLVAPPVVRYPAYRPVLVPAPVYAPAPVGTFNYYGRGYGISVGF
jgi:hypothetical protein